MQVRTHTLRKWEKQHNLLDGLYDRFKLGDEIEGAVAQFVPELGEHSFVHSSWAVFQAAEILLNVGTRRNPIYGVMKTREEAHESLKAQQLAERDGNGSTKPDQESILRHVAGPDDNKSAFELLRPLRKDESAALVESARQYLGRKQLKAQKLRELREGGINIPDGAIPLQRDERLENVLLTLPFIDSLLSADKKYEQLAERYRELETVHSNMKRSYDALKRWRDQQMANAVDGVALSSTLDRKLDEIEGRTRAKANGHAESGAANGGAEDPAGSGSDSGGPEAGPGKPEVGQGEARPAQSGDSSPAAAR